jgi:hypothetical protein
MGRLIASCCTVLIVACVMPGCSESEGNLQGQFIDSPVEGLTYETLTISGTTDSRGSFFFSPGERVTFSIGGIVLGTTRVRSIVTPVDLVPGARDENNPAVINIVRILLTLDQDNDPDNGITISTETSDALAGVTLIFDQTPEAFTLDPAVQAVLDAAGQAERTLCSLEQATGHLAKTLEDLADYSPDNDGNSGAGGSPGGG